MKQIKYEERSILTDFRVFTENLVRWCFGLLFPILTIFSDFSMIQVFETPISLR